MKKILKENWGLLLAWLLVIILAIFLLISFKPPSMINNIIQAIAIISLVFVTIFYARQTQRLANQEKKSIEEQRKKNRADFWESRLKEYYLPFKRILLDLTISVEKRPFPADFIKKKISDLCDIYSYKQYMVSKDLAKSIISFMEDLNKFGNLIRTEKKEDEWSNKISSKSQKIVKQIDIEIRLIEEKLKEIYWFFTVDDFESKKKVIKEQRIKETKEDKSWQK